MLKIKDNVDLKVLEHYGFKHHKKDKKDIITSKWFREDIPYNDDTDKSFYAFYPIIEILENRFMLLRFGCYNVADNEIVDTIYNLIQDGIIEKV